MRKLTKLMTESQNDKSNNLDEMSTGEIIKLMNEEDQLIPIAIKKVLPQVEMAVNLVRDAFKKGGRLFYVGAGTSGRIGLLDAVECPPTFSTDVEMVQAVIAGGEEALLIAVEGAEDDEQKGKEDLTERGLNENDVVIGIAASGRTPYVKGALAYGQQIGAKTISLTSNENAEISQFADVAIEVITGPEILTGSTRLKAATAHKMILNMISTAAMVKIGKVYNNFMVDLNASNYKLKERAKNIVSEITGVSYAEATDILEKTNYSVKLAIVMILADVTLEDAYKRLKESHGYVKDAINLYED